MRRLLGIFFLLSLFSTEQKSWANGFAPEDTFTITKMEDKQAVLTGTPKELKAGDLLYFARSPYRFTVSAIEGSNVTIVLPEKHDLKVGSILVRKPNAQMKKSLDTEGRLKQALEE